MAMIATFHHLFLGRVHDARRRGVVALMLVVTPHPLQKKMMKSSHQACDKTLNIFANPLLTTLVICATIEG